MTPAHRRLALALAATLALCAWIAVRDGEDEVLPAGATPRPSTHAGSPAAPSSQTRRLVPAAALPPLAAVAAIDPAARSRWPALDREAAAAWGLPPAAPVASAPSRVAGRVAASAPAAAPPPPPVVAPVRPAAPPFGYALIGNLEQGGRWTALLGNAQRGLAVRAGDVVDGQWRVEQVLPAGVDLVWLPQALPLKLRRPT